MIVNPLVTWIWIGGIIVSLGALIARGGRPTRCARASSAFRARLAGGGRPKKPEPQKA